MLGTDRQISETLSDRILSVGSGRIRKIILYGSRASGNGNSESDFDLLVVEADPVSKRDEMIRLRESLKEYPVPVDVWVMGELEFEETKEVVGGLAYPAHKYGVVLNEIE